MQPIQQSMQPMQSMQVFTTVSGPSLRALRASVGGRVAVIDATPSRMRDTWHVSMRIDLDQTDDGDRADYIPHHSE